MVKANADGAHATKAAVMLDLLARLVARSLVIATHHRGRHALSIARHDGVFAARRVARQSKEARARKHLDRLLHDGLDAGERARLMAEGATMSEEDACRLALAG